MDTYPPVRRTIPRSLLWLLLLLVMLLMVPADLGAMLYRRAAERLPDFTAIFLGIFIEAAPFLFLGTLTSGLVEVFFGQDFLVRIIPRRAFLGALTGGLLGLCFPVCECGVVPLTRRLLRRGMPLPAGIAFLLAAPVLNPVVIASTAAAFGWGKLLALRVGLTLLIALITGLVFSAEKDPRAVLRPGVLVTGCELLPEANPGLAPSLADRWRRVLLIAMDEFFEMGRYLVIGALLAAGMQVFVPQGALLSVGQGPLASVLVLTGLAALLSICSTVDAFIALSFAGTFSLGSLLGFLVFGPMVDIKSLLMYGRVFRPVPVLYLVLIPLLIVLQAGLLINYFLP